MRLKTIKIGKKTYPLICDLNVLEEIQNVYPTIQEYERELLGLYLVKNENGEQEYNSDGTPKMGIKEPSLKSIKLSLILMINEGLRVQAYIKNTEYEEINEINLISECDIRYSELAMYLHGIYAESMQTKKL